MIHISVFQCMHLFLILDIYLTFQDIADDLHPMNQILTQGIHPRV